MTKTDDDIRMQGVWSTVAISMILFMLMALTLTGCQAEESYCYTGINARNAPRHFVVVERADEATHYVPDAGDERLTTIYGQEYTKIDDAGRYVEQWPSCGNMDNFDQIKTLELSKIIQKDDPGILLSGRVEKTCDALMFSGVSNVQTLQFNVIEDSSPRWWYSPAFGRYMGLELGVYHFLSHLVAPEIGIRHAKDAYGVVYISHIAETGEFALNRNHFLPPTGGRSAFEGAGKAGEQPPFIMVRLWHFSGDARPEAEMLLGKDEMEGSGYICADMYYGYFAQK